MQREGAFQWRGARPRGGGRREFRQGDLQLHSFTSSLIPSSSAKHGRRCWDSSCAHSLAGETDKSGDNCKARESERRESHAMGI